MHGRLEFMTHGSGVATTALDRDIRRSKVVVCEVFPLLFLDHPPYPALPNSFRDVMAPKKAKEPKKKPALKDLRTFVDSQNLTRVMLDMVVGESRSFPRECCEHDADGTGSYLQRWRRE